MTVILDVNILVYAIDTAASLRHAAAGAVIERVLLGGRGIVILQAMTEFYSVATRGDRHGLSFWDAMLWATGNRVGVSYLLTEDCQDGRTFGGVTFVDPFRSRNARLLAEILPAR